MEDFYVMGLLDDIKAKADTNGDGKVDAKDLEDLKAKYPKFNVSLNELKKKADTNADGKVDVSDASGIFDGLKGSLGDIKTKLFK